MSEITERLARLTATADRLVARTDHLVARDQLAEAQREIALAKLSDPSGVRVAIREAAAQVRAERIAAEREARRRAIATAPQSLDIAEVVARDPRS